MKPSDRQSGSRDLGFSIPSDESSDTDESDVEMGEVGEDTPSRLINIGSAIDLMRFVFKEGLAFLDNGSGRSLPERMLVDMGCFMANKMLEQPAAPPPPRRDAPNHMRTMNAKLETDIAHAFAKETRKGVAKELHGDFFGLFVDKCSPSNTWKYYMVIFARYVNDKGEVVERLLGIVPDPDISGPSLKATVQSVFSEAGLSLSSVRGQGHGFAGYSDEIFSELKSIFFGGNGSAYYAHPHVRELHSLLVTASYDQFELYELLQTIDVLSNLIQKYPQFTEKLCTLIQERGVNLDNDLRKAGETNWGSYYEAIVKFAAYFVPVCDALDFVQENLKGDAEYMAYKVNQRLSYAFVFSLLLMQDVLGATNELSLALNRNGFNAENCVVLLQEAKKELQVMRDEGWTPFLNKIGMFCNDNDMYMVTMGEQFVPRRRSKGDEAPMMTNLEHYHLHFFQKVINKQLEELDKRFSKESSDLVLLASCLNPRNNFQAFDKDKLVELARLYPSEFSSSGLAALDLQLQAFITDERSDSRFLGMDTPSSLSVRMVETGMSIAYPLVYLLLKLVLILPRTPATGKKASTAMKFIDNTMREEPCNQWISDCLLMYLEPDIFESITNDDVIASL